MGNDKDKIEILEEKVEELTENNINNSNTIARLENDLERLGDPNSKPRVIQKGNQKHPRYVKNTDKIAPILPKENPVKSPKKK